MTSNTNPSKSKLKEDMTQTQKMFYSVIREFIIDNFSSLNDEDINEVFGRIKDWGKLGYIF